MKTYKERTADILIRAETQRKKKKKIKLISVCTVFLCAIIGLNLFLFIPYSTALPSVSAYKDSEYYPLIQQINALTYRPPRYKNNFEAILSNLFSFSSAKGDNSSAEGGVDMAPGQSEPENGYVEVTNNQEEGVIEGDLFKRTKDTIFYLNVSENNYILESYPIREESTAKAASYTITAGDELYFSGYRDRAELYLDETGTRATVISPLRTKKQDLYTVLIGLDVSDPLHIKELGRQYISGNYLSSRYTSGDFLVINEFNFYGRPDFSKESEFVPQAGVLGEMESIPMQNIVCPENANATRYTIVCRIDGQSFGIAETFAFFSYSEEVYVSQDNIFVTFGFSDLTQTDNTTVTEQKTQISCISYQNNTLALKGSATVNGSVKDRYSMDEHAGILRVATTLQKSITTQSGGNAADGTVSNQSGKNAGVYCIRLSDFAIVGFLENFVPWGEEVTAARFDDQNAYICTAYIITFVSATDPVYIVDLSDPENIVYKDTGIIPGYSTTLYPFKDGTLLGVGYNDSFQLKIELYRETETNVESVTKFELDCDFAESFKSYYIDPDAGYFGLLIRKQNGIRRYLLLCYDGYQFVQVQELRLYGDPARARATVIGGYLYAFCDGDFAVGAL